MEETQGPLEIREDGMKAGANARCGAELYGTNARVRC